MKPRLPSLAALALLAAATSLAAAAGDWPQFRGPAALGVAPEAELPLRWDVTKGDGVRWKTPIPGLAHSSPIIAGDRIYVVTVTSARQAELKVGLYGDIGSVNERDPHQWRLLALDRASGRIVWDTLALEAVPKLKRHPKASHANSTPATDGRSIVAILGSEGLFCFDTQGRLRWKRDLGPMDAGYFKSPTAQWGFASSPIIHEGRVVVQCDVQKDSFLAVFDLADGRELWRTPRGDVPTWSTPAIVTTPGRTQIVVNGWRETGGYDFATGRNLWMLDGGGDIPVPTPIFALGLIYLTSAHGNFRPLRAIRPDATGNITPEDPGRTNASIAWAHGRRGNYMQTPIVVGDLLFACNDQGIVTCVDARTGDVKYSERLSTQGQGFSASPVSDGRHLYFPSEPGEVYVVPAAASFSVRATLTLGETCMASPAVSGGTLFFRTRGHVIALGR